jgi:hypothetical protein
MKLLPLISTVVLASISSALALSGADIAPAALAGKTLIFDITNGGPPYAEKGGVWSMTFSATATSFSVANISGNTVPIPTFTSCSSTSDGTTTTFTLSKFLEGQNAATLFLYTTMTGEGGYELFIDGVNGVSLNGPFTIGSPPLANGPEIVVKQGSDELTDGASK